MGSPSPTRWRAIRLSSVTIATSVLFSLLPIGQAWRLDVHSSLKDGGRTAAGGGHPLRGHPLVAFQVSLSVLLLIGAALFLRTLANLRSVKLGFRPEQVVLFTIDPPRTKYVQEARQAVFERIDRQVAAIPGVEASSLSETQLESYTLGTVEQQQDGVTVVNTEIKVAGDDDPSDGKLPMVDEGGGWKVCFSRMFDVIDEPTSEL